MTRFTRLMPSAATRWMTLGLLAAAAGALSLPADAAPFGHGPRHGDMAMAGPLAGGPGMGRLLERIGASEQQRTQLQQIFEAARNDLKGQRETTRALREQMHAAFTQANVDANAVEALRVQLMAQHETASKRMTQAMVEASRVLSPEQRQQIGQLMAERRARMERGRADGRPPRGPGN